ncbi:MAG: putative Ig domain-containing protein [Candidatus Acidiferrales bacterium]
MNRFRAVATVALVCVMLGGLSGCVNSSSSSSGPLSITTTSIPATATVGSAYAGATISATGGTAPLSFTLSSGQLPTGLTLARTGSISGAPRTAGAFVFVVQVQDSHNPPHTAVSPQYTITVSNPTPPVVNCPTTLSGGICQLGTFALGATVNITFTATGASPFRWSNSFPLPYNLTLNATSGVLGGQAAQAGTNQFTVSVTDVAGQTSPSLTCSITITPGTALVLTGPSSAPNGVVGTPYGSGGNGLQYSASGGLQPYTWNLSGNPPPGLTISSTGLVSGIPSMASSSPYAFEVEVQDAQDPTMTKTSSPLNVTITSTITVAITNPFAAIDAAAPAKTVNATVTNDISPTNGVNWTFSPASCNTDSSSPCGTLAPVGTTSVTYTPPATVPTGAGQSTPEIIATAVDDPSKSANFTFTINAPGAAACATGSESSMNGSFAYLMKGFDANGAVAIAGSFHADGTGKITGGVEDINRAGTGPQTNLAIDPSSSSYTLGADGRGCMTLATAAGQQTFRYSMAAFSNGAPTEGNIIEFDDKTGEGTRGSGILRAQDASSFSNEKLASGYAFGLSGSGVAGEHVALAGTLTADGNGNIVGGNFDRNDAGNLTANSSKLAGTYSIPAGSTTGRGTFNATLNSTPFTFAAYMVNSGEVILAGVDQISATNQITSGEALATAGTFSNGTLAGNNILRETAMSRSGSNPGTRATIGVLTFDGKNAGGVTGTLFDDEAGVSGTTNIQHGAATYSVDAGTGRITFTGVGTDSPVGYIVHGGSGVTAFLVGTDSGAADGALEFQSAANANFKTSTFSGAYSFGTDENVDYSTTNESHSGTFGKSSNATVSGESDQSQPRANGLVANQPFSNAFIFNSEGIGTSGKNPAVTNGTRIFFIDEETESTHPRVTIAEKQ